MQESVAQQISEHWERSSTYWRQALEHHIKGELEKTTELAWGSVLQMMMALILAGGQKPGGHGDMKRYIKDAAHQLGDRELADLFSKAEAAHANFYRDFMDEEEVQEVLAGMERLREKLQGLMARQG